MYSSIFWCRIYFSTDNSRSRYFSKSRPCRVCFFTATTSPKYFPMYTVENAPSPTAGPIVTCNNTRVRKQTAAVSDITHISTYSWRCAANAFCYVPQVTHLPGIPVLLYQIQYTRCGSTVTVTSYVPHRPDDGSQQRACILDLPTFHIINSSMTPRRLYRISLALARHRSRSPRSRVIGDLLPLPLWPTSVPLVFPYCTSLLLALSASVNRVDRKE